MERRRNGVIPGLPYLAPWYRLASADDAVVLEYGQRIICLAGRAGSVLVPVLLPLLDGTRTLGEIVEVLGEPARPAIEAALERLTEYDLLVDGPPLPQDAPRPLAAVAHLLASLRPGGACAPRRCRFARNALRGRRWKRCGRSGDRPLVARERRRGVPCRDDLGGTSISSSARPPRSSSPHSPEWNNQALVSGQPWLQVLPFDGRYACVGPLYLPAETCCFECFRRRRSANLPWVTSSHSSRRLPRRIRWPPVSSRSSPGSRRRWRFNGSSSEPTARRRLSTRSRSATTLP